MRTSRIQRRPAAPTLKGRHRDDAGYVVAMTALLLLPLLAFAGLAVDLGSWYARATEIQRAADAASLAGVASLPRGIGIAQSVAIDVAGKNGFEHGVDGVVVTAEYVDPDQVRVTITDTEVPQYLTAVFRSSVSVSRSSLAEYIPPVKMGSPRNYLGMGPNSPGGTPPLPTDNFWLAVSSPCASKENGDRIQALTDANRNSTTNPPSGSGTFTCNGTGTITNDEYQPNGYFYALRFENNYSGSVTVDIFDAAACYTSANPAPASYPDGTNGTNALFTTSYQMRSNNAADPAATSTLGAPLVVRGNAAGTGVCATSGTGSYRNQWRPLYTLTNPTRGTYYIQVQSSLPESLSSQGGSNSFSLRAREGTTFSPCTTESTTSTGYRANCPNLFAIEHLGVAATIGGSTPSWYLADIGPEHSGKTMEVALWDPGEGSLALELLNPLGNPVTFRWRVVCATGDVPPNGGCGPGNTTMLDLEGTIPNMQPGPRRLSTSKYSDRLLILEVALPSDITAAYSGNTWWRIRYTSGTAPTDRTTWGVTIKGDPVRLVE